MEVRSVLNIRHSNLEKPERLTGNVDNVTHLSDYSYLLVVALLPLYLPCDPLAAFFTEIQWGWLVTQSYRQGRVYTHLKQMKRQHERSCPVYHIPDITSTNVPMLTGFQKRSGMNMFTRTHSTCNHSSCTGPMI